jgi:hypothetical protein
MSRLHRARRELKRRVEQRSDPEEATVMPDEAFQQEVEAEIGVLLAMFREKPEAKERLSVLLRRSPERFVELIRQAPDAASLDDLALLLRRLGRPAMEAALAGYQATDPYLPAKAADLLRRSLTVGQSSPTSIPAARIARREAYLLLDRLFESAMPVPRKVRLVADLMEAGSDERTTLLLTHGLLCYPDEAFSVLMVRFRQTPSGRDLHRRPDVLYALGRTGTRFAATLLPLLASRDEREQELALEGAEAVARAISGDWLNPEDDEGVALDARFRRKWAPPFRRDRDPVVLAALAEAVASFLADERAPVRDRALRILGLLKSRTALDPIRACVKHPSPGTRVAALRALGQIGDAGAAELLLEVAREGRPAEQSVAIWALGRLRIDAAVSLLTGLVRHADRDVRAAAVTALGEIGGDTARATLEELQSSHALYAARSLHHLQQSAPRRDARPAGWPSLEERTEGRPPLYISLEAAMRALPELRTYGERELSRLIGTSCLDFASTRRYLVDEGLMSREAGIYQFTGLGETVWRVEQFIREHYLSR